MSEYDEIRNACDEKIAAAMRRVAELKEELAAAQAQRDNEIQKRKEMSEAVVKLFKYLRPHLTEECQKLVDEADSAIQECGK